MKSLKDLRIENGKTQMEMAEMLGITHSAYSYYESGARKIPAEYAMKISNVFGVKLNDIFLPSSFSLR